MESIVQAIMACQVLVLVLVYSGHAGDSKYVFRELSIADENKITIIPVHIMEAKVILKFKYMLITLQACVALGLWRP
jgi:hypothetical protein